MPWAIEHVEEPYPEADIDDWAVELQSVMPEWDWDAVQELFQHGGAFSVAAKSAARIAEALRAAACSSRMHPAYVPMTETIGRAAHQAARSGQPWRWI
jgi:hypothetical protein